ncbi:nuclear transport factor 2 family protein [Thalassotalea castellviae]|uniref:Nuclear transport factor 2 family protein n=1 Tax=Thalassotalea castellviae TaxID=3075612 RepID=A0ABU3A150_9GAMM|nr:nuclear transport factor 2 family protein [Thalassotalea sp. W431]MDT0603689.1 nuclear transport factor 2 family protein [Thalassotalea sp. W431]
MNKFSAFVLVLLLILTLDGQAKEQMPDNVKTVEQFVAFFNAQDSGAMASLVVDDIEWLSIVGNEVIVEAKGKNNLMESMNDYFKSCSTCKSELSDIVSTKSRVSAVEIASWQGKNGQKSQRAISVYEFSAGLIARVYYFPAEK